MTTLLKLSHSISMLNEQDLLYILKHKIIFPKRFSKSKRKLLKSKYAKQVRRQYSLVVISNAILGEIYRPGIVREMFKTTEGT